MKPTTRNKALYAIKFALVIAVLAFAVALVCPALSAYATETQAQEPTAGETTTDTTTDEGTDNGESTSQEKAEDPADPNADEASPKPEAESDPVGNGGESDSIAPISEPAPNADGVGDDVNSDEKPTKTIIDEFVNDDNPIKVEVRHETDQEITITQYGSFDRAFAYAQDNDVIRLLGDTSFFGEYDCYKYSYSTKIYTEKTVLGERNSIINANITLLLDNHTLKYSGTEAIGLKIKKNNTLIVKGPGQFSYDNEIPFTTWSGQLTTKKNSDSATSVFTLGESDSKGNLILDDEVSFFNPSSDVTSDQVRHITLNIGSLTINGSSELDKLNLTTGNAYYPRSIEINRPIKDLYIRQFASSDDTGLVLNNIFGKLHLEHMKSGSDMFPKVYVTSAFKAEEFEYAAPQQLADDSKLQDPYNDQYEDIVVLDGKDEWSITEDQIGTSAWFFGGCASPSTDNKYYDGTVRLKWKQGDNRDCTYLVSMLMTSGKVVLHKKALAPAVCLDPTNKSAKDTNDGLSPTTAVKTFKRALEICIENDQDTISVMSPITINDNCTGTNKWDGNLGDGKVLTLQHYTLSTSSSKKPSEIISIESNGALELTNIVLDGCGDIERSYNNYFSSDAPMIKVKENGILVINSGTTLKNGRNTNSNTYSNDKNKVISIDLCGGAINNQGTLIMNDGLISNCHSCMGAGICNLGTFWMTGGEISNNNTYNDNLTGGTYAARDVDSYGDGGGVINSKNKAIMYYCGGVIKDNKARNGGGIAVGTGYNDLYSSARLFMGSSSELDQYLVDAIRSLVVLPSSSMSGTPDMTFLVQGNSATATGGGIFIASGTKQHGASEATITAGTIDNNSATGKKARGSNFYSFPGGGIYINGAQGEENGILNLKNVDISYNTAGFAGGGVGVCPSGNVRIYLTNGAVIHDNNTRRDDSTVAIPNSTVYVQATSTGTLGNSHLGQPKVVLSSYMLGGGSYNWEGAATGDVPEELSGRHQLDVNEYGDVKLSGEYSGSYWFYSSVTDESNDVQNGIALSKVFIQNNSSGDLSSRGNETGAGGGIGANGDLNIGTADQALRLAKLVNGGDAENHKGDEFEFTVSFDRDPGELTVLRNGMADEKPLTFEKQEFEEQDAVYTATLKLRAGDIVLLYGSGLEAGMEYTITETVTNDADGTTVTYTKETLGVVGPESETTASGKVLSPELSTSVEFTNTFEPDTPPPPSYPRTGSLVVTKTVTGSGDRTEKFHFRVELSNTSINGRYGDMTFANGVAEFDLAHGERATASGLPAGVTHKVTESDYSGEGYVQSATGDSGTITAGGTRTAAFTNHRGETGSLTITKTVTGGDESFEGKEFTFTVSGPDGYRQQVTLHDGESVTLDNLAPGTYTVTEDETGAVVAGWDLSPFYDGLDEDNSIEVEAGLDSRVDVTNSYERTPLGGSGTLTITKRVQGGGDEARSKTYTFDVYDRRTGERVASVTIDGEGTATVEGLPVGEYMVVERDAAIDGLTWDAEVTDGGVFTIVPDGDATVDVTNVYGPGEPEEETEIPDGPTPTTPGPRYPSTTFPVPTMPTATTTTTPGDTVEIADDAVPLGYLPKTGDPTNLVLVASVAGIAVAAMALGAMLLKKEGNR